jgi:hypothetical protein
MRIFQPTISGSTNTTGSLVITGSLRVSEGITGSLLGTASWAINVVNGGGGSSTFPYTGSAIISGSLIVTGSTNSSGGFTGSLFGTSSWAVSASRAISASFGPNIGNTNLTLTGNRILTFGAHNLRFEQPSSVITEFNDLGVVITGSLEVASVEGISIHGRPTLTGTPGKIRLYESNPGIYYVELSARGGLLNNVELTLPNSTGSYPNIILADGGDGQLYFTNQVPTASLAITASLASRNLLTASVSLNTITFTKGDGSTFPITINTGSGGGGSVGTLAQVTALGASTTTPITASIISASSFTGSLQGTASWALNVVGGGGGPSYITPPFFTGSILYWDGTKVTGSNVMDYDGSILSIDTGYFQVTPEAQFGQDVTIFGGTNLEGGAVIYGYTIADAIVLEKVDPVGTTSGSYGVGSHILTNFSSTGPTLTPGRIVYISGSGQWAEAIASADTTSTGVLGVVTTTANQNNILLNGIVKVSQSLAGFTNGSPVYLATSSAGTITQTPPSTVGHVARYVGYVLDSGSRQIYFNPDFTWIEL